MAVQTPEDYINYLITNNITISLLDFVKELNSQCENIDISFIDELLYLVGKKEICISYDLLKKYGVVTTNRSNNVLQMLEDFGAVENKDYLLLNVQQNPNGGRPSKEYTLHPRVFKYFLMNSKNMKKYKIYYIILEECIKYYTDYQLEMEQLKVKSRDDRIDTLINELKISNENSKKLCDKLDISNNKLDNITEHCENLQDEFDVVYNKLDDNVPNAKTDIISERFVILKHDDEKKYYVIARKERTIKITLNRLNNMGYKTILLEFKCCPNARLLFNAMKDKMQDYCKFTNTGNGRDFILLTTEQEYMDKLTELYNSRREYKE